MFVPPHCSERDTNCLNVIYMYSHRGMVSLMQNEGVTDDGKAVIMVSFDDFSVPVLMYVRACTCKNHIQRIFFFFAEKG